MRQKAKYFVAGRWTIENSGGRQFQEADLRLNEFPFYDGKDDENSDVNVSPESLALYNKFCRGQLDTC